MFNRLTRHVISLNGSKGSKSMTESDTMTPSCLDMTKELTIAVIHVSSLPLDDMPDFMRKLHTLLLLLQAQENAVAAGGISDIQVQAGAPVDWKKSISAPCRRHV